MSAMSHAQTLMMNSFIPAQLPMNVEILKPWARDVEKATDGRVRINFTPTSMGSPQQQFDIVRKHIVDGAYIYNGLIQNQTPLLQVAHLPLGSTTAKGVSVALWRTYTKYFEAANEFKDVQLLALFAFPPGQIFSSKEPILSAESMKGVKLWATPGVPALIAEQFHAAVVSTPAATMTQLVAGGTVDGLVGIEPMGAAQYNVIRYARSETVVPGGVDSASFSLFLNKAAWESISAADRDTIKKLSGEAFANRFAILDRLDKEAEDDAVKNGLKVVQAPPKFVEEIRAVAAPMDAQWIATAAKFNVDGKAAMDFFRQEAIANAK